MPGSDSGGSGKGGLFSQPSTTSLDDLLGPDGPGEGSVVDVPEPATMARFVPFKVDVSETGEHSSGSDLSPLDDEPDKPAVVQFVPETPTPQVSDFTSSQPAQLDRADEPSRGPSRTSEALVTAPEPPILPRLNFPKPELTDDVTQAAGRSLTPLVKGAEPENEHENENENENEHEQEIEEEHEPEPPASSEMSPSEQRVTSNQPGSRTPPLEEADWGDAPGPQGRAALTAQVEALPSSDPVGVSEPPPLAPRPMVAPPPSSQPLHPAMYLLLLAFGVAAILALALPLLL